MKSRGLSDCSKAGLQQQEKPCRQWLYVVYAYVCLLQ